MSKNSSRPSRDRDDATVNKRIDADQKQKSILPDLLKVAGACAAVTPVLHLARYVHDSIEAMTNNAISIGVLAPDDNMISHVGGGALIVGGFTLFMAAVEGMTSLTKKPANQNKTATPQSVNS